MLRLERLWFFIRILHRPNFMRWRPVLLDTYQLSERTRKFTVLGKSDAIVPQELGRHDNM